LSSAILYLAIVAIWACALVPRWLRRPQEATSEPEVLAEQDEAGDQEDDSGHAGYARRGTEAAAYSDHVRASAPAQPGPAGYNASRARPSVGRQAGGHARSVAGRPGGQGLTPGPAPRIGRARVLRARRRMLTMLVTLAVAAVALVAVGLTRLWTAFPPLGMLGLYLMLLREAARADAEASRRQEAYARARATRAAQLAGAAPERATGPQAPSSHVAQAPSRPASTPQPSAEVIDISGRAAQAGDQLYDQYADATVRAVGD
jgi:hypothetical protein